MQYVSDTLLRTERESRGSPGPCSKRPSCRKQSPYDYFYVFVMSNCETRARIAAAIERTYPVVMLFISCLASCWCLGVTTRLCVGVDVATSGSASDARATCVKMGGMVLLWKKGAALAVKWRSAKGGFGCWVFGLDESGSPFDLPFTLPYSHVAHPSTHL